MGKDSSKKRDRWDSSSSDEEDTPSAGRKVQPKSIRGKSTRSAPVLSKSDPPQQSASSIRSTGNTTQGGGGGGGAGIVLRHNPLLQGCRSVHDTYERIDRISEGTYGVVWKARDIHTDEIVALKQIKFHVHDEVAAATEMNHRHTSNGFPVTALREINVLMALSHECIVTVREMVVGSDREKVYMVMEFFDFDLSRAVSAKNYPGALPQSELKGIMQHILRGAQHMHEHWYLHRDLKPSNILVRRDTGQVALADLGLARRYQKPRTPLTLLVVTLWYRAPELLFGESCYGPPIDMWSVGCIFGELILGTGEAIFQGQGELDQIDQIFALLGIPTEDSWPNFRQLPHAGLFRWRKKENGVSQLPTKFPVAKPVMGNPRQAFLDNHGFDLLAGLLALDPTKRITAQQALDHPYFHTGVQPKILRFLG